MAFNDLVARVRGWLPTRLPTRRVPAIPSADLGSFLAAARKTALVRAGLGLLLAALAAICVWDAVRLQPNKLSFLPQGSSAVVALDMSKSVYVDAYKRVAPLLEDISDSDASVGLVGFSDIAYELVPPRSHGSNLRPMIRFFLPVRKGTDYADPASRFLQSPWQDTFSGGTQISAGLDLARTMLRRDNVPHGVIILVSDLESASPDVPKLIRSLIQIKRDHDLQLRIVALSPGIYARKLFETILGKKAFIEPRALTYKPRGQAREEVVAGMPTALAATTVLLALLLALNELSCAGLVVRRRRVQPVEPVGAQA